jgi:2-phospho-L-lactate/phosphoenolpyruvate guanylyltransferase
MNMERKICAVVPVKEARHAKRRLAGVLGAAQRRQLALAMLEDVLAALARAPELAAILVVTIDQAAMAIAMRYAARVVRDGACAGHSGAVAAAATQLAAENFALLTVPGDVPLIEPGDIRELIAAHRSAVMASGRAFIIVPARDGRGSNAVLCSPAAAVPLRFGDDSFAPHLRAAKQHGISPCVLRLPRIALDIDTPEDLAMLLDRGAHTRAGAPLRQWRLYQRDRSKATA